MTKLIKVGDCVLDVGCGNGSSLLGPLSHKCAAYGVDMTEEMLLAAKQHHRNVRGFFRSDACCLPFPDESFDLVYSSRCLINVLTAEMQEVALREMFRVARAGGTVVLIENFEEPLALMNQIRKSCRAGRAIVDAHNLQLNLRRVMGYARAMRWNATVIRGNTLGSFMENVLVAGITRDRGTRLVEHLLYPLYLGLSWLEDQMAGHLPLLGKDTMVVFKRATDLIH